MYIFEINVLKIEICLTITNNTNLMQNKLYLLFAGLKHYIYNKLTPSSLRDLIPLSVKHYVNVLRPVG